MNVNLSLHYPTNFENTHLVFVLLVFLYLSLLRLTKSILHKIRERIGIKPSI